MMKILILDEDDQIYVSDKKTIFCLGPIQEMPQLIKHLQDLCGFPKMSDERQLDLPIEKKGTKHGKK